MRGGLPVIVATLALSLALTPLAHAVSLCVALVNGLPHCREARPIGPARNLSVYRMNNSTFAGELCMWGLHRRVCAHGIACSAAEYAKERCP